ncbi:uncharacterized protein LOC120698876 [Panicum virgatum]|uniref:uncharacterized protein LOC120698876 n=1 Tax=Panicum virgatum TaxID=38727 RepID=UPI0019D51319|nr:uncharacterized protein LOC120698876 [Panicum virgatum]
MAAAAGGQVGVDLGSGGKGDLAGSGVLSRHRGRCFGFVLETTNWLRAIVTIRLEVALHTGVIIVVGSNTRVVHQSDMVAGAEMRRSITGCSVGGAERHVRRAVGIRQGADDAATQSDSLLRGWLWRNHPKVLGRGALILLLSNSDPN